MSRELEVKVYMAGHSRMRISIVSLSLSLVHSSKSKLVSCHAFPYSIFIDMIMEHTPSILLNLMKVIM